MPLSRFLVLLRRLRLVPPFTLDDFDLNVCCRYWMVSFIRVDNEMSSNLFPSLFGYVQNESLYI